MTMFALTWIGLICWCVCFWWMHRISARQDALLKELHEITTRIEHAPAYTSVAVFCDPVDVAKASGTASDIFDWLATRIGAATVPKRRGSRRSAPRTVEIPVCYDPEFAPDLEEMARHAQISTEQVVELHSAAGYRVACIGFVSGFPFMAGLPKKIATPRRSNPRKEIPPGVVGIGGAQTG